MFVRSVGSVPKSGPVRSGLRSRIGLALISVRIGSTKIFPESDQRRVLVVYVNRPGRDVGSGLLRSLRLPVRSVHGRASEVRLPVRWVPHAPCNGAGGNRMSKKAPRVWKLCCAT